MPVGAQVLEWLTSSCLKSPTTRYPHHCVLWSTKLVSPNVGLQMSHSYLWQFAAEARSSKLSHRSLWNQNTGQDPGTLRSMPSVENMKSSWAPWALKKADPSTHVQLHVCKRLLVFCRRRDKFCRLLTLTSDVRIEIPQTATQLWVNAGGYQCYSMLSYVLHSPCEFWGPTSGIFWPNPNHCWPAKVSWDHQNKYNKTSGLSTAAINLWEKTLGKSSAATQIIE